MKTLLLRLNQRLPKHWLLSIYGALGGLLGALILGELLFPLLSPPTTARKVVPLQIAVPDELRIFQGGSNRLPIKIARDGGFNGPVSIQGQNLPAGISLAATTISAGNSDGEIVVSASETANLGDRPIEIAALGEGSVRGNAQVTLTIMKPPAAVRLSVSPAAIIEQRGTNRFMARIARDRFEGEVRLNFIGLPADVAIPPSVIPASSSQVDVVVTADITAAVGDFVVTVEAQGPREAGSPKSQAKTVLTIRKLPPPELRLSLSPHVVIDQQGKNKFMARIARDRFEGDVQLTFSDLPKGVTIPNAVIPADKSHIDLEATADKDAAIGDQKVSVEAEGPKSSGAARVKGVIPFTVKRYEKPSPPPIDILFLLDVTGSMQFAIDGVRDGIQQFTKDLQEKQLDVRVGMIAFRDRLNNEEPEILMFGQDVFTKDFEELRKKISQLRADGGGDEPESSPDAIVLGSKQDFRKQCNKVIVLITDASPKLPDKDTPTIEAAAKAVETAKINQLHLVIHNRHRQIYEKLRNAKTGGQWFDLQKAAARSEGFAKIMPEVSREIARTAAAPANVAESTSAAPVPPPANVLPTGEAPLPPTARSATDIAPAPELPVLKGVTSTDAYAADSSWRLVLATSVWTAVIAGGVCLLLILGQILYLRQNWGPAEMGFKGFGGGLLAGLAGGAAGQMLYQFGSGGAVADILFRIIGWTILGALAGIGMSFFIPNLRRSKGLMGGALGGAIGALGFIAVVMLLQGSSLGNAAARVLGAMLLGACIGLMVAIAERIFRSAWLEINLGENVVKLVNLGPEPVSIGSDSRQCTIYARNAPAVALKFWTNQGRLIQKDMATGMEKELRGGEVQKVGAVEVAVFTSSTARSAPQSKTPVSPTQILKTPAAAPPPKPASSVSTSALTKAAAPPPPPTAMTKSAVPPLATEKAAPPPVATAKATPPPPPAGVNAKAAPPPPPPSTARPASAGSKPAESPGAKPKEADGCPSCGRKVPGNKGDRYCMVCDATF